MSIMDDIKLNECDIIINNKKIKLSYPVKMYEKINGLYIILLNIPTRTKLGITELNNIVCYDDEGEFRWRIDNELPGQIANKDQTPYIAIQVQDNILKVTDFFGRRYHVNSFDGRLLKYEVVK